ncbi:DNA polymerase IV [Convivina praedatoris]|uniref:DNA polymerase IV n=2 Tax=Convivina praedatoris TaxID=2880963 RepID=A0ABN8HDY6_9LACO|nr:DNA polymerase IV [Convivina sp. LMG 32447]CAH1855405.1 DNA polymerase IV [Convivina sp. LMG 32447]CAH1855504.1 DNA polymerase IV [Convivina sp. LMG 32447]
MLEGIVMGEFLTTSDSRKILHVDLDAFYAQIEMRDNPRLKKVPLIVGRDPQQSHGHGVVATANYLARELGVHSAMSTVEAIRLAPQAVFLPPNFDKYRQNSRQIHAIFHAYTDKVEAVALDEAYLDLTNHALSGATLAAKIRHAILKETKLTSSIGISYNKLLAKLGSEYNKPNGVTLIDHQDAQSFMACLPIENFRGVGKQTLRKLLAMNIHNGLDLRQLSQDQLRADFGKMGEHLYWQARGVHFGQVDWQRQRHSIGKEATFDSPLRTRAEVSIEFQSLAKRVVDNMQAKKMVGRTLNIKMRADSYQTITRAITLSEPWQLDVSNLARRAQEIFDSSFENDFSIRLLGLTFSNLQSNSYVNLSLFDD